MVPSLLPARSPPKGMRSDFSFAASSAEAAAAAGIVKGRVTVTRAPALHPGDIQIATAVGVPDGSPLNSLDNCVVFSQQGARDLPSQLSSTLGVKPHPESQRSPGPDDQAAAVGAAGAGAFPKRCIWVHRQDSAAKSVVGGLAPRCSRAVETQRPGAIKRRQ